MLASVLRDVLRTAGANVRIVCISDTHQLHDQVTVPECDVLIHAGDACNRGTVDELLRFRDWFAMTPAKHRVFVPGNHDASLERVPGLALEFGGVAHVLVDRGVTIDDVRFYGAPWQPEFCGWAFNLPRGRALAAKWALIPGGTDVLVTHGPPMGTLDKNADGTPCGCDELAKRVRKLRPALHVFGHIHESAGRKFSATTRWVNAAVCDGRYRPVNAPTVVEL